MTALPPPSPSPIRAATVATLAAVVNVESSCLKPNEDLNFKVDGCGAASIALSSIEFHSQSGFVHPLSLFVLSSHPSHDS